MIKKNKLNISLFSLLVMLLLSNFSAAQIVDVSQCRIIENPQDRFSCYESLSLATEENASALESNIETSPPSQESSPPAARISQPTTASESINIETLPVQVENFGQSNQQARTVQGENGDTELIDVVAELKMRSRNLWLITLESGQVWRQMSNKAYYLKKGDEVRIYPSGWGSSYRLTAKRISGYIQVERAK